MILQASGNRENDSRRLVPFSDGLLILWFSLALLPVLRQGLLRRCILRILLECAFQPARAFFASSKAHEHLAKLTQKGGIVRRTDQVAGNDLIVAAQIFQHLL